MTISIERPSASSAYRAGVGLAAVTAFGTLWTTVVRDDGNGAGFFMVILAAVVGAFAAWFRPAGMARAMLGVAVMQGLLAMLIATAPSTAAMPGAGLRIIVSSAVLAAMWLASAACFRAAAKSGDGR